MTVIEDIGRLGANRYEGSSVEMGVPYQNIPGMPEVRCHRDRSDWRGERICELVDVKGKRVLDLGCSVGTISGVLKKNGAEYVLGVDHDVDSVRIARDLHPEVNFEVADISISFLASLERFDVVVWTSQFMWMVKQLGMERALEFLFQLSKKCDVLVFETATRDGSAPINLDQEDILPILIKNTCFQDIRDFGPWNDNWSPRNVFVCRNPKTLWVSHLSRVERIDRTTVRKSYEDMERAIELKNREEHFLKLFQESDGFPVVFGCDRLSIDMEYEGLPAIWISDSQVDNFLNVLRRYKVVHRDIRPENILFNGVGCVLIDFAYAIHEGDITNYHYDLGGEYRSPHGYNDEFSFKKVQFELMKRQGAR